VWRSYLKEFFNCENILHDVDDADEAERWKKGTTEGRNEGKRE
jgi:hypothetical protein